MRMRSYKPVAMVTTVSIPSVLCVVCAIDKGIVLIIERKWVHSEVWAQAEETVQHFS
jgi:hypothetical protein